MIVDMKNVYNLHFFPFFSLQLMASKVLTVELHANAKTDMNSLIALVKMCQFRPELTSIIVSGVIAQIEYSKKQATINTTKGVVASIKA